MKRDLLLFHGNFLLRKSLSRVLVSELESFLVCKAFRMYLGTNNISVITILEGKYPQTRHRILSHSAV